MYTDKSRIVEEGNYYKFSKSTPEMWQKLLGTGDRELVEVGWIASSITKKHSADVSTQASPTDRIWGVGFGAADAEANREQWGENRLGKCIMAARDRMRKEAS